MRYVDLSTHNCSVQRTIDIVGEKWTFAVLRDVFNGLSRFDDLQRHSGVPRPLLAKRLATLVEHGLLERVPYRVPGQRTRAEYRLTQKGLDLYPVIAALRDWGDRYVADPGGPAGVTTHKGCGAPVHVVLECEAGHRVADRSEVEFAPGPGAVLASH
jgi:DNA-binding HxlR family transcriptional regulator